VGGNEQCDETPHRQHWLHWQQITASLFISVHQPAHIVYMVHV